MRIRTKIVGTLLGMSLLVALVGALAVNRQRAVSIIAATKEAEHVARVLSFLRSDSGNLFTSIQDIVAKLHETQGRDVVVVDAHQRILADAVPQNIGTIFEHDGADEVGETINDRRARIFVEISEDYPAGIKQVVVPVQARNGEVTGAVILEYTQLYDELMSLTVTTTRHVAMAALGSVVVALLISFYMGRSIATPLRQLTSAATKFAAGETDSPMPHARPDEIGELANAFSDMVQKRQQAEETLRRTRDELEVRVLERTAELGEANLSLQQEVTERRQAQEELQESELRFRQLAAHITKVFWMATPSGGELLYVSPAYEKIWGRTCASLYAHPCAWFEAIVPEYQPSVAEGLVRLGGGENYEVEYRITHPNGAERWILDRGFPIRDEAGAVVRMCGIAEDITERKASEARLQTLSRAIEQSPVSIIVTDANARIEYVNPKFVEMTGYTAEEVRGKNPRLLNSGQTPRHTYLELWRAIRAGREWCGEFRNRRKDGELYWELATISAIRDAQGVTTHFVAVKEDVTARKAAEADLRWKNALHEAQVNSASDGILIVDVEGRKVLQNRRFADLWMIPQEILDQDDDAMALQYAVSTTAHPERFREKVAWLYAHPDETAWDEIEMKDGRFLDRYSSPVRGTDGKHHGRIWMFRDITERKRAEADLTRLNKQLVEASRQAGMAEVATSVLHNVGNVLNSVNVSTTLVADSVKRSKVAQLARVVELLDKHSADLGGFISNHPQGKTLPDFLRQLNERLVGEQQSSLREIESLRANIEHIKEIVSMQQSYATLSGVAETVRIADLVEDSLRMNGAALIRHEVEVVREFHETPPITIEKHKVLQILVNLIRNAKYACDEGRQKGKRMTLQVASGDGRIKVSISDNGIGIPPENLTRIFNHGFTTRKDGHGFGLHSGALAAKDMGGALSVHSDGLGHGATFTLELPLGNRAA